MVDQEKQAAATKQSGHLNTASDIDTDSETDEEETEFEKWKRRELERIKREEAQRDPAKKPDTQAQTSTQVCHHAVELYSAASKALAIHVCMLERWWSSPGAVADC
jgi:Microfibril-associated/Pre-mRNA processing